MAKNRQRHESNAKSAIALLIVLLAFGMFVLFYTNKDAIIDSGDLKSVMTVIIMGMGFLIGLLYLVNAKPKPKPSRKR